MEDVGPSEAGLPDLGGAKTAAADPEGQAPGAQPAAFLRDVGRGFSQVTLKKMPSQERAQKTLARILNAGRSLGLSDGLAGLTLQAVAERAAVSLATVYRYFSTSDDLVRLLVREAQLHYFNRFRAELATLKLDTLEALAATMVMRINRDFFPASDVSQTLGRVLLRDYHRIAYDELWDVAGAVVTEVRRRRLGELHDEAQSRLAIAFAAAASAVKMAALKAPRHMRDPAFSAGLEKSFLIAMRKQ